MNESKFMSVDLGKGSSWTPGVTSGTGSAVTIPMIMEVPRAVQSAIIQKVNENPSFVPQYQYRVEVFGMPKNLATHLTLAMDSVQVNSNRLVLAIRLMEDADGIALYKAFMSKQHPTRIDITLFSGSGEVLATLIFNDVQLITTSLSLSYEKLAVTTYSVEFNVKGPL